MAEKAKEELAKKINVPALCIKELKDVMQEVKNILTQERELRGSNPFRRILYNRMGEARELVEKLKKLQTTNRSKDYQTMESLLPQVTDVIGTREFSYSNCQGLTKTAETFARR